MTAMWKPLQLLFIGIIRLNPFIFPVSCIVALKEYY
jgi:hypothetical protein